MEYQETLFSTSVYNTFANLMAGENLNFHFSAKNHTAAFDLQNRVIHMPLYDWLDNDIAMLMIAHECSHALHTPPEGWHSATINRGNFHGFLNVVEDARIEGLIKKKFPGMKRIFIRGYRKLVENDFFGTANKDVNEMLFIDRLNIKVKTMSTDIVFTDETEMGFYRRCLNLKTWEEAEKLATEIYDYCHKELKQREIPKIDFIDPTGEATPVYVEYEEAETPEEDEEETPEVEEEAETPEAESPKAEEEPNFNSSPIEDEAETPEEDEEETPEEEGPVSETDQAFRDREEELGHDDSMEVPSTGAGDGSGDDEEDYKAARAKTFSEGLIEVSDLCIINVS